MERFYLGAAVTSVAETAAGGSVALGEVALSAGGCAFPDFASLAAFRSANLLLFASFAIFRLFIIDNCRVFWNVNVSIFTVITHSLSGFDCVSSKNFWAIPSGQSKWLSMLMYWIVVHS
jgi:hypothetical protein